jgi:sugar lactone lactonase YvrE
MASGALALALTLVACQSNNPPAPLADPTAATKSIRKADTPASLIGLDGASLIGLDGASLIGLDGASLIGLDGASLIGLDGASLIGLDGASLQGELSVPSSLIGLDGASLIGLDGASLIGLDGASLIGLDGASYRLQQNPAAKTAFPGVAVYLRTAEGKFVVGTDGKPLSAKTDAEGKFSFPNLKAQEALFFYVPLGKIGQELHGLAGLRTADQDDTQLTRVNTESSLLCTWLERDVLTGLDEKEKRLNRLSQELAEETLAEIKSSLTSPPDFRRLTPVQLADQLKSLEDNSKTTAAEKLKAVRYTINPLAGTNACEGEDDALKVALRLPRGVAALDDALFVSEAHTGIVYRIDPDGRRKFILGPCAPATDRRFAPDITHFSAVNGWLYLTPNRGEEILRVRPDGTQLETLIGTGEGTLKAGDMGTSGELHRPGPVARALDGNLWVADGRWSFSTDPARIFKVDPEGKVLSLHSTPWDAAPQAVDTRFLSMVETTEGLWVLAIHGRLGLYFQPKEGAWRELNFPFPSRIEIIAHLLEMPDNSVLLSLADKDRQRHVIEQVWSDGRVERFAGKGPSGLDERIVPPAPDALFNAPAGLTRAPDGRIIVADSDNGLLRAIHPETKEVSIIAGIRGALDAVALNEALNAPWGIALNKNGDVYVSEGGAHTIRRLRGNRLERVAGGVAGLAPEGQAPDSLLNPTYIAFAGDDLVVMETTAKLVRRIRNLSDPANARIETLAGKFGDGSLNILPPPGTPIPPKDNGFQEMGPMTVDPQGRVVFASLKHGAAPAGPITSDCIWRIEPDGSLLCLVGSSDPTHPDDDLREGKLGTEVRLRRPLALAYDTQGNLFFSELGSVQVFKLGSDNIIRTVAGSGTNPTLVAALAGTAAAEQDVPAREAALLFPAGLLVAPDGTLYISELGTAGEVSISRSDLQGFDLENLPKIPGRIRRLDADGRLKTIVGSGAPGGPGDVKAPFSLALTPDGKLLYIDLFKNQLQELNLKP